MDYGSKADVNAVIATLSIENVTLKSENLELRESKDYWYERCMRAEEGKSDAKQS